MGVVKKLFGGADPGVPAAAPLPPTPTASNMAADTSSAVTAQATPSTGRSANISAGNDPTLSQSGDDQYSVRKKLLGY